MVIVRELCSRLPVLLGVLNHESSKQKVVGKSYKGELCVRFDEVGVGETLWVSVEPVLYSAFY